MFALQFFLLISDGLGGVGYLSLRNQLIRLHPSNYLFVHLLISQSLGLLGRGLAGYDLENFFML